MFSHAARVAPEKAVLRPALPMCSLPGISEMQMSTYSEKLRHPNWQKKRLEILNRDGFKCVICDDGESTLNVHHSYYEKGRDPWDYNDDSLMTLCDECHEEEHEFSRAADAHLLQALKDLGARAFHVSALAKDLGARAFHVSALAKDLGARAFHVSALAYEISDASRYYEYRKVKAGNALQVKSDGSPSLRMGDEHWMLFSEAVWSALYAVLSGNHERLREALFLRGSKSHAERLKQMSEKGADA